MVAPCGAATFRQRQRRARRRQVTTRTTVHALLLLYGETVADVQVWGDEVGQALAPHGMKIVHQLALDLQLDEVGIGREHFGFADGMSQPIPFGDPNVASEDTVALSDGRPAPRDPWHGVPLGEILLGHTNAHAEKAPGPLVRDDDSGARCEAFAARSAGRLPQSWSQWQLHGGA